jgi:type III pantothenate kinase
LPYVFIQLPPIHLQKFPFPTLNLVLDIGNTRTKLGLFRENLLVEQAIWLDWTLEELESYGKQTGVEHIIISSVAEPDSRMLESLRRNFEATELTHQTPLPFLNTYQTPLTLGKDRLAGVAGAMAKFEGEHCLVVDCGTCIKYDLITLEGVYHGGNIAPGATMRLKAMRHFTARLPEAPMVMPEDWIGSNTETALQNGALKGAALEIEGFARLFAQKASPLRVVLTGGDAGFFVQHLDIHNLVIEKDLTLIGLNHILNFNKRPKTSVL